MDIDNLTPLPEFVFVSAGNGIAFHTFVLRGDYEMDSDAGGLVLADEQIGPRLMDVYYGDPNSSSIAVINDRVPLKPRGEVLFENPIARPRAGSARRWPVSIRAGDISTEFVVTGPRHYQRGRLRSWRLTEPEPASEVPVRFESTYGGGPPDNPAQQFEPNPVGSGHHLDVLECDNVRGPQIELTSGEVPESPIAITPVSRAWLPRRAYAGTFSDEWLQERWPFYPHDFSFDFYQQAPADLQLSSGYFSGNELVRIEGLGRRQVLEFELPEVRRIELVVVAHDGAAYCSQFEIDTLVIDPERERVSVIWRTSCVLPSDRKEAGIIFAEANDE